MLTITGFRQSPTNHKKVNDTVEVFLIGVKETHRPAINNITTIKVAIFCVKRCE